MKELITAEENLVGKVIEKVKSFGSHAALIFTDGTAAVFYAESEYDGCCSQRLADKDSLQFIDFYYLGLVSEKEFEEHKIKEQKRAVAQRRKAYEQLKSSENEPRPDNA